MFPKKVYKSPFITFATFNNCNARQLIGPIFHVHASLNEQMLFKTTSLSTPNSLPHYISRL